MRDPTCYYGVLGERMKSMAKREMISDGTDLIKACREGYEHAKRLNADIPEETCFDFFPGE